MFSAVKNMSPFFVNLFNGVLFIKQDVDNPMTLITQITQTEFLFIVSVGWECVLPFCSLFFTNNLFFTILSNLV